MNELTSLINNVGFPIFACIYMFKNNKELVSVISELSLTLKGIDTRLEILEQERNL